MDSNHQYQSVNLLHNKTLNRSGEVPCAEDSEIYGLAIATYDDIEFYRFSCDKNWNTVQDALYDSVAAAKDQLPDQYRNVGAEWTGN